MSPPQSFENLSDDSLAKEASVGFLLSRGQEQALQILARYARAEDQSPIFVVAPWGYGKTTLVREFAARVRRQTEVEWINVWGSAHVLSRVAELVDRIRESPTNQPMLVVLEDAEVLPSTELQYVIDALFNRKKIRNVIVTTRAVPTDIRRKRIVFPGAPDGKLYGLREQLISPPPAKILSTVAPKILVATDLLIEKLKQQPDDIFRISPRQFEEVIADLLADMGMEVELTPATRDGGKDILAYMKTEIGKFLCLVEAKQHNRNRPVGVGLVRALFGKLKDHSATSAMLVTTSRFARPAKEFQERHKYQLSLKDYGDVASWILKYKT
ncbi:MAG TPA: restriction endonuclease [Pyrinomonadaceae bacterium]|nr:restriction endonuclease [Pyrinomonadaceae bacterium]